MKTKKREDQGLKQDTIACVALIATAVMILITGAVNVHNEDALQVRQAQQAEGA